MARRSRQHSSYNSSNLHATIVMPTFLAILGSLTLVQPLLWQIVFIIGSLSVIFLINQWLIDLRILRLRRRQLLELSPSEFEQRVALLLEDLGWKNVVIRGGSGDRGVDITAERDGLRYLVQCKRYSKSVGPNYVRDLVGALHIQGADRAILVATSSFTPQSRLEARGQAVELWDDKILLQRLSDAERIHNAKQVQRNQDSDAVGSRYIWVEPCTGRYRSPVRRDTADYSQWAKYARAIRWCSSTHSQYRFVK